MSYVPKCFRKYIRKCGSVQYMMCFLLLSNPMRRMYELTYPLFIVPFNQPANDRFTDHILAATCQNIDIFIRFIQQADLPTCSPGQAFAATSWISGFPILQGEIKVFVSYKEYVKCKSLTPVKTFDLLWTE